MAGVLVDTNVIIDILTENKEWFDWSAYQIKKFADACELFINPIIYAEISIPFATIESLKEALPHGLFINLPFTQETCFLAGKAFHMYRKNGGSKKSPLPDFFIGAQAAVENLKLISRDGNRYKTYFPTVDLVSP